MGMSMEVHAHLPGRNGDLSGHIEEMAEDLSRLCLGVAAHALREEPVEPAGEDQQCRSPFARTAAVSSRLAGVRLARGGIPLIEPESP